jgi:WD40 repeat protein
MDPHGVIERWSLPDAKPLKVTEFPAAVRLPPNVGVNGGLGFADNDRVVAWGHLGNRMVAWDAPGGNLITPVADHPMGVQSVQFAANGREIVTAGYDARVVYWDAGTGKTIRAFSNVENDSYTRDAPIAVAPGGRRGLQGAIVFDVETGLEAFRLPGAYALPSADFTHAISFGQLHQLPPNGTTPCTIWNLDTRKRVSSIEIPGVVNTSQWRQNGLTCATCAFSPDHSRLVTVATSNDPAQPGRFQVVTGWDVKTGKKLGEYQEESKGLTWQVAAADNRSAVLSAPGGRMWVVDYEKGARGDTIDEGTRNNFTGQPTFGPDGKTFAVGAPTAKSDEWGVRIYSWPEAKVLHTFAGHSAPVNALAFSPDGKTLASGSADSTVLVWDLSTVRNK